jgi:hypothetical protein
MTYRLRETLPRCLEADTGAQMEAAPGESVGAASDGHRIGRRRESDRRPYEIPARGQRGRAVLTRGRGRADRPSRSAATSITISAPSAMIRVPSGSIDPSLVPRRLPYPNDAPAPEPPPSSEGMDQRATDDVRVGVRARNTRQAPGLRRDDPRRRLRLPGGGGTQGRGPVPRTVCRTAGSAR